MTDPTIDNMQTNTGSQFIVQQQESVEVERNTKGYNFTVKLLGIDLTRLKTITDKLNEMYPNKP